MSASNVGQWRLLPDGFLPETDDGGVAIIESGPRLPFVTLELLGTAVVVPAVVFDGDLHCSGVEGDVEVPLKAADRHVGVDVRGVAVEEVQASRDPPFGA
ncbi:hypothetical protein UG54_00730 [Gordonia sihwensis]|nr:hypothetical protein UG54_00730 [Gordonia sihwensis]